MSSNITLRLQKGAKLTYEEGDNNFKDILKLFRSNEDTPTAGGTENAITIESTKYPVTVLEDNSFYGFKASNTNTADSPTLDIDGTGAKEIVNGDGSTVTAGTIESGLFYMVRYDADTDTFRLFGNGKGLSVTDGTTTVEGVSAIEVGDNFTVSDNSGSAVVEHNPDSWMYFNDDVKVVFGDDKLGVIEGNADGMNIGSYYDPDLDEFFSPPGLYIGTAGSYAWYADLTDGNRQRYELYLTGSDSGGSEDIDVDAQDLIELDPDDQTATRTYTQRMDVDSDYGKIEVTYDTGPYAGEAGLNSGAVYSVELSALSDEIIHVSNLYAEPTIVKVQFRGEGGYLPAFTAENDFGDITTGIYGDTINVGLNTDSSREVLSAENDSGNTSISLKVNGKTALEVKESGVRCIAYKDGLEFSEGDVMWFSEPASTNNYAIKFNSRVGSIDGFAHNTTGVGMYFIGLQDTVGILSGGGYTIVAGNEGAGNSMSLGFFGNTTTVGQQSLGANSTLSDLVAALGSTSGYGLIDDSSFTPSAGNFTELTDAPSSYTGQAGKAVVVNGAETGVEFSDMAVTVTDGTTTVTGASTVEFGDNFTVSPGVGDTAVVEHDPSEHMYFNDGVRVIFGDDSDFYITQGTSGSNNKLDIEDSLGKVKVTLVDNGALQVNTYADDDSPSGFNTDTGPSILWSSDGTDTKVGFYGTSPIAKPTVTGSTGGNAALQSLLTALENLGLITDSTT